LVSSAYSPVDVHSGLTSARSLMKSKKSIGPKMLPCGTPEVTGDHDEEIECPSGYFFLHISTWYDINGCPRFLVMHHKVTSLSVIIQMELPEIPFSGESCGYNPQRLYNELSRSKFEDKVSLTNHITKRCTCAVKRCLWPSMYCSDAL
jgi:hypothetical protein